jgi:glycyl-tRNA synthetase beta chain
MSDTRDLLIEMGCEELPAKNLLAHAEAFAQGIEKNLAKAELTHGKIEIFATPRRLAIIVRGLITTQSEHFVERKGPAVEAAFFSDGKPTAACIGFARSCGVAVEQLQRQKTDKGEWMYFRQQQPGVATQKLIPEIVASAVTQIPIAKPMRWGANNDSFIRPVKWLVLLFGNELIDTHILGVTTSDKTYGHRFLHPGAIKLKDATEYQDLLKSTGKVIPSFSERREMIEQQLKKLAGKHSVIIDKDLLNEVTGIVEWPVVLQAKFSEKFLEVPAEALISSMKAHQKCFHLVDAQGKLLPTFLFVSNLESKKPEQVIAGNERVMTARLADASFFYHSDLKHSLSSQLDRLKNVVFQTKLGSLFDKSERIAKLATFIFNCTGEGVGDRHAVNTSLYARRFHPETHGLSPTPSPAQSAQIAERAGLLAKTDLLSDMVSEFPELQGVMGYYYALQDKEPEAVAIAIKEHYLPRFSGDVLPETLIGAAVAIADRLDTLVGIFGIQQAPTGEKDPFGLRRAALAVLRILIEKELNLDLRDLLLQAVANYGKQFSAEKTVPETFDFIFERLRAWYAERDITPDVFAAVHVRQPTQPFDFHRRILAVQHFRQLPEAAALAAANKRVSNILKKENFVSVHSKINPGLFEQKEEHTLADLLGQQSKVVEQFIKNNQYTEALVSLATLQKPVDAFFDHVLVNVENEQLRQNRLALLMNLRNLFLGIADISLLQI